MISQWRNDRFCTFDFGRRIHRATLERALTLLPSRRLPLDRFKARRLLEPYVRLIEKQNDLNVFQIGEEQTNKQTNNNNNNIYIIKFNPIHFFKQTRG